MKIYIAGPITAATSVQKEINVVKALNAGIDLIMKGHTPYISHLSVYADNQARIQGREITYEQWMSLDDEWLRCCDALLYLAPSPGADREMQRAKELGITVFMSVDEVPMICTVPYQGWPETLIKRIGQTVIVHRGTLWVVRRGDQEKYCHCDAMAERLAREWEKWIAG